jgi:hypothetical protein
LSGGKISQNVTGVGRPGTGVTNRSSTPKARSASCRNSPNGSSPVREMTALRRPWRAAATATFVALPPRYLPNVWTSRSDTPTCSG